MFIKFCLVVVFCFGSLNTYAGVLNSGICEKVNWVQTHFTFDEKAVDVNQSQMIYRVKLLDCKLGKNLPQLIKNEVEMGIFVTPSQLSLGKDLSDKLLMASLQASSVKGIFIEYETRKGCLEEAHCYHIKNVRLGSQIQTHRYDKNPLNAQR